MQLLQTTFASSTARCFCSRRSFAPRSACRSESASASAVSKEPEQRSSRREAVGALAAVVSVLAATPAHAFLGIGEGETENDTYIEDTKLVLGKVEAFLAVDKDDPKRDDVVTDLRNEINTWVAKYRRRGNFTGRPSFGVSYTILNALAGSFNSFGNNAPLPKKRLERINKELVDANRLLARGR